MSDARIAGEAFALTSDPGAYVPNPERERALERMAAALAAGAVPCLEGPTGIGKTLLLQLLVQRVADRFDPLYVPYPMLTTPELCTLAIGLLGHSLTPDPEATLLRSAAERAARGRPLLLLIDDATSLPPDTARGLARLRERAQGALHFALAGIGGPALTDASAGFGAALERISLEERIPRAELREYVAAQLDHASAPASLRRAFDDQVLEELERAASGNPRRLHLAAQSVLRRAEESPAPPEPVAAPVAAPVAKVEAPAPRPAPVKPAAPAPPPAPTPPVAAPPRVVPPPAPAAPPAPVAPPRIADPTPAEPVGEYRVVRKRTESAPEPPPQKPPPRAPSPAPKTPPAREASPPREVRAAPEVRTPPTTPPSAPAADVDQVIAEIFGSRPAPLPTPPWQAPAAPAPVAPARPKPDAAERAPRRVAMVPVFLAVALVSAVLGFVLASQLKRDEAPAAQRPAVPATAARTPTPTAAPVQVEPAPAPAPEEPVAESAPPAPAVAVTPAPIPTLAVAPPPMPVVAPAVMIEISINAAPWALIEIDGREVGETPLGGIEVERGPHRFVARFPDGRVVERTVAIDASQRTLVFE